MDAQRLKTGGPNLNRTAPAWSKRSLPLYTRIRHIIADAVFQAGEVWEFIIQEFVDLDPLGRGPAAIDSWDSVNNLGLVGNQSGGDPLGSTGSIIVIPEPATLALLSLGGLLLRRRKS